MQCTASLKNSARLLPDAPATVFGERTQTWRELQAKVAKFAGGLKNLSVEGGDRVAILALNSDRYTEYYFGVWWSGAVVVPMNTRWSVPENAYSLNDSGAQVVFVDDAFCEVMPDIQAATQHALSVVYIGEHACPADMLAYEQFIEDGAPRLDANRSGDDLAGIFYTGGTTGFPKGVMLSHQALWYNAMAGAKHLEFNFGDSYLHVGPMFHLADGFCANAAAMVGATHYYIPTFAPDVVQEAVDAHQVTHSLMVPTMIQMVLENPNFDGKKFSSLAYLAYGASPMPEGVLLDALQKLPDVGFIQAYGQTELAPLATVLGQDYHVLDGPKQGKLRSAGRPGLGVNLRILDEAGEEVPRGEVGEIAVSSPGIMLGYWNKPEETASALVNGEVRTGDGAYMDDDGFVYIVDRLKDMIVSGGENVFSAEVESAISTHPTVAGVVVIGIPDEKWGEAVHAIVIPAPGCDVSETDILDHCRGLIANYKCPRSIEVRTEPFPLSGAGKVLKRDLRAPYWDGKARSVN